jgi:hypothetical protein
MLAAPELFRGRKVGLILCGGNIDPCVLASIMVRELELDDRIVSFRLIIMDRPKAGRDCVASWRAWRQHFRSRSSASLPRCAGERSESRRHDRDDASRGGRHQSEVRLWAWPGAPLGIARSLSTIPRSLLTVSLSPCVTPSVVSSPPNGSLKRKIGHLRSKREQCRRHVETQEARGLLVDHSREVGRLQHRQICRILAA